jgi:hypothetical protein
MFAWLSGLVLALYGVYDYYWGECECEGCEHDAQKERDWMRR